MNFSLRCFLGIHRWGKTWKSYLFPDDGIRGGVQLLTPSAAPVVIQQRWCCERWPCRARRVTLEPLP